MKFDFLQRQRYFFISTCLLLFVIGFGVYFWRQVGSVSFLKTAALSTPEQTREFPADVPSLLSEKWVTYDKIYSPVAFSLPESWGKVNVNMWWADPYTQGTRYEYYFKDQSENNLKPHSAGWRQSVPIALRVETNDSVYRGSNDHTMISAAKVDLSKTDEEIKQMIALPWTQALTIERITVSGKDGLYVEESGQSSRTYTYRRIYYLFPKFNDALDLNLTIAMQPEMKDVLDRLVQGMVFKSGFNGSFEALSEYKFNHPVVDTREWQTVTNAELGISYKLPSDWAVSICNDTYPYNNNPVGCDYGRAGIILGPKKEMRLHGEDLSFSLGYTSESSILDRVAMAGMEALDNENIRSSLDLPPMDVKRLTVDPFIGVLLLNKNDGIDLVSYRYHFNINNHSVVLSGTEGSYEGYPSYGTFRAILDSIRIDDIQSEASGSAYEHYTDKALGFSFDYPKEWGSLIEGFNDTGTTATGTQKVLFFSRKEGSPRVLIETVGYRFLQPQPPWYISIQNLDLRKTDKEIVNDLSVQGTASLDLKRIKIGNHEAAVVHNRGSNPVTKEPYEYTHYYVPKFNDEKNVHFSLIVDSKYNGPSVKYVLESLKFSVREIGDEILLKNATVHQQNGRWFIRGNRAEWFDDMERDLETLVILGVCEMGGMDASPCMSNPFYLYDTGERLEFPIRADVSIGSLVPASDSGEDGERLVYRPMEEYVNRSLPFLLKIGLKDREVVSIQERYVP